MTSRSISARDEAAIVEVVREARSSGRKIAIRGGGSKASTLWRGGEADADRGAGFDLLEVSGLSGIVEYQPEEFTVTARAGTPVEVLRETLALQGQYLPFDPLLGSRGATVAGTVAAGANGPGRIRYGGVRDFVLAVRFVDGTACAARAGGKVVKNAAGFDLPKFFCGSLGRFAVLTELTFKVFPRPQCFRTVVVQSVGGEAGLLDAVHRQLCVSPLALYGLEYVRDTGDGGSGAIYVRLGGPDGSLDESAKRVEALVESGDGSFELQTIAESAAEERIWRQFADLEFADLEFEERRAESERVVVKVATTPSRLTEIEGLLDGTSAGADQLRGCKAMIGVGGQRMFLAADRDRLLEIDRALSSLGLQGLVIAAFTNGPIEGPTREPRRNPQIDQQLMLLPVLGSPRSSVFLERIRQALDPGQVFW